MEPRAEIVILCATKTPRLSYVANYLSSNLGVTFMLAQSPAALTESGNISQYFINYSDKPTDRAFNIYSAGLLQETEIRKHEPELSGHLAQPLLYPAPEGFDLSFDVFSAVFYLLSRYEEYLPFKPDKHGRFEADQAFAYRHNFLEVPVVDQWMDLLRASLKLKFSGLNFPVQKFRFVSTIDVDSPWAYRHKGLFRIAGGLFLHAARLNTRELKFRLQVLSGKKTDPFDTYEYIRETEQKYGFESVFFFLSGNYGRYDVNYALNNRHFIDLLDRLRFERTIGIHPSLKSTRSYPLLNYEFKHFARLLGEKPIISRQHFLMLKLPELYRQLIRIGILVDYSMGYASLPGFRAGTSLPFRFYDLGRETETNLLIHPFQVMDVTLKQYLGLSPGEALQRIHRLVKSIKEVHGVFTSLWHNESLSEYGMWKGWREVFEGMVGMMNEEPACRQAGYEL
jgi:hypothetical protein